MRQKLLLALACVMALVGGMLGGCGALGGKASEPAPDGGTDAERLVKSARDAEDTVRQAVEEAGLTVTSVYEYAPFDGMRDVVHDGARGGKRSAPTPQVLASSAFYPFVAGAIERLYAEEAYRAGTPPESVATSSAFVRLAEGQSCIVVASPPNAEQRAALDACGRDIRCVPVARDALLFYTRDGPAALTQDELRAAYGTEGLEGVAHPVALAHGNGSTTCFETFMSGDARELAVSAATSVWPDMNAIIASAALANGSLGYCYRQFWHRSCSSPELTEVAVDGVAPTAQNVARGAYPLLFDVCVMYDASSEVAPEAEALIEWLSSPGGRAYLTQLGLCPA